MVLCNYQPGLWKGMVVGVLYREDVEVEVVDYICNGGGFVGDYDIGVIVDNLLVRYRLEGVESYCDYFGVAVCCGRREG